MAYDERLTVLCRRAIVEAVAATMGCQFGPNGTTGWFEKRGEDLPLATLLGAPWV